MSMRTALCKRLCLNNEYLAPSVFIQTLQVRCFRGYRDQHKTQAIPRNTLEKFRIDTNRKPEEAAYSKEELSAARRYRYVHPEFLPPAVPEWRDEISERLEREDMMKRRLHLEIPEFYVGSLMAVTLADPYADGLESRFVGICIERAETGLRHNFTLRNVVDGQGIEIMYELYNPTIKKIEVLKLEKRLDEELLYLRDCPPEYSTIPFDLEATPHPKGAPVPINPIIVPINPKPWRERWERFEYQGLKGVDQYQTEKRLNKAQDKANKQPWEKYDLMMKYRNSVPTEDVDEAYLHFIRQQAEVDKKRSAELDKKVRNKRQNSEDESNSS